MTTAGKPGGLSMNCHLLKSCDTLTILWDTAEGKKMNKKLPELMI